ncbi:MAG TPA: NfeD family protein [Rhizobiales bacterium]|nr:NfeD family protein [Hyphomicrobiales bacterium]
MLASIFSELGPWNWFVIGFALLALEIVVPGVFLLWIGIAALVTGALSLLVWDWPVWIWQVQVLVFLALSLVSAFAGKQLMGNGAESDLPLLNRRADQLVGRTATLSEPIVNGWGRVRIDDTVWKVNGPDLPAGTIVRVVSAKNGDLSVTAA